MDIDKKIATMIEKEKRHLKVELSEDQTKLVMNLLKDFALAGSKLKQDNDRLQRKIEELTSLPAHKNTLH